MKPEINQPDAARLIYGLRDTGYNFNSAAADIIDNSIAAEAENVNVKLELKSTGERYVYFGDDGIGMSKAELTNAMRYGAAARTNQKSLGKFGLGLKTASSSVCLKFSIISRSDKNGDLAKVTWDLEHVEAVNAWEMLHSVVTAEEAEIYDDLCGDVGTLVVWSRCDRLLNNNADPGGAKQQAALKRIYKKLNQHCALVYQKYLDHKDLSQTNINISVNGESVSFWNPFYPQKSKQVLHEDHQSVSIVRSDGEEHIAEIKAWVLPHRKDMKADEEKEFARISNGRQGFYIFREGRLIHQGNWLGLWTADDPHYSLIRVELNFNHELDEAFEVDVRKSKIKFDGALEDHLKALLQGPREYANNVYRRKQQLVIASGVSHKSANQTVENTPNTKKPVVKGVDQEKGEATVANNLGGSITIKAPIINNANPDELSVIATNEITDGSLWEPCFVSASNKNYSTGVRLNKHHDFYTKIYSQASSNHAVDGMDLLFWALAAAESSNTSEELKPMWEDIREEVASNLKKLLRDTPLPAN